MSCYRPGGCGPYEYLSCYECPASKPEYAVKRVKIDNTGGRYISQDKLDPDKVQRLHELRMKVDTVDDALGDSVELVPVVHGRWRRVYDDSAGWVDACDKCGAFGDSTLYCPHCGAKMDL